jgi:hypothetical protein
VLRCLRDRHRRIKYDRGVDALPTEESLIIRFGPQLPRERRLSSGLGAEAVTYFGEQGTVEAALIGDYVMAGITLHAID